VNKTRRFRLMSALIATVFLLGAAIFGAVVMQGELARAASTVQHYEYFTPDGSLFVYDIDNGFSLVKQVSLPTANVRGVSANAKTHMLYVSYGGDGGGHGTGSLLAYNLLNDTIVWNKNYSFGIDSMDITPDGQHIYMPDGEAAYDATWHEIDATSGNVLATISIGTGYAAHNTLVNSSGTHVYMGALNYNYLVEVNTADNKIIQRIGPLTSGGVRPFTINRAETLAFTTTTGFIGFDVSSITTGKKLYTVAPAGFVAPAGSNAPAHGITLSPDEKTVYIVDGQYSYVHVYDVSGLPANPPVHLADIKLQQPFVGNEVPCGYDCTHEGWILYTADGRYVLVGDSGDVIDAATRKTVMHLQELQNTRKYLEVDWSNGSPIYATSRMSVNFGTSLAPNDSFTPVATATSPGITPTSTTPTPTTPLSGAVVAQDNFTRANQTYWGTTLAGSTWGGDANNSSAFSIVSNKGQVSGGANPYSAVLGPAESNADVLMSGSMSSYSNANIGALLRWTDTNNWYKAYISGTTLVIQKKVNGTTTTLSTKNFTATAGTSYTIRFDAVGSTLSAKVWQTGTTEPTNWISTVTDTSFTSGFCGIRIQLQSGISASFTSFVAKAL
jgi:hypothetical protein